MNKSHRKILLKHRLDLTTDLEPNEVMQYLYQEDILTENDVELIKGGRTRKEKVELLLDTIPRKGPKAFNAFVSSLKRENGTKHLADLLDVRAPPASAVDSVDSWTPSQTTSSPLTKRTNDNNDTYSMKNNPRGLCLIFNNREFLNDLSERVGSDVDARNLQHLFASLKFNVRMVNNASADKMKEIVNEVAEMDHSGTDCLVTCLLSHGTSGNIYGSDGELIPVSDLLHPLIACEKNSELISKPRLFFIQACRVLKPVVVGAARKEISPSYEVIIHDQSESSFQPADVTLHANDATKLLMQETATPSQANIVMSYSTLPGEVAWRNLETGSWFIDAVVDVFKSYASSEDVVSMLIRVNNAVAARVSAAAGAKQIPAPIITLTKKLYFKG
eukprot:Seg1276.13 transcript_id=Seg1276.13/GoldUCD/mRNA.D3Y31 product=Caspase-2 protein_id=Seg1276.13/GoldUCD/D3Y31